MPMKKLFLFWVLMFSFTSVVAEEDAPPKKVPAYVSLGDPMVLNLSTKKNRLTFLQLKVDILVEDDDAKEAVTKHIPAIRHKIILLLSEQDATDMKTPAKRNDIRKLATEQIQELMDELADNDDIEDVLFSQFLIQ